MSLQGTKSTLSSLHLKAASTDDVISTVIVDPNASAVTEKSDTSSWTELTCWGSDILDPRTIIECTPDETLLNWNPSIPGIIHYHYTNIHKNMSN